MGRCRAWRATILSCVGRCRAWRATILSRVGRCRAWRANHVMTVDVHPKALLPVSDY